MSLCSTSDDDRLTSPDKLRDWALSVLLQEAPDSEPSPGGPDEIVLASGVVLGLQDLHAALLQGASERELRDRLVETARHMCQQKPEIPSSWSEARALLRPQLMPAECLEQSATGLVHRSFHSGVLAGLVVDRPGHYACVRALDVEAWSQSEDEVWRVALHNLDRASADLEIHASEGAPDRWMALSKRDGYDAARILVPGLREFFADHLGEPFYAGVPNRDLLVVWSADNTAQWWDFIEAKLQKDCSEQPYPLTSAVSVVTSAMVLLGKRPMV